MRTAALAGGLLLAGVVAGVVVLVGPAGPYGVAVGLGVAMPLLRADAVGLPDPGDPLPPAAGARALTASAGALVVAVAGVVSLDGTVPSAALYGVAVAGAYLGSYALDLGLTPGS
ncbi:MAG: hypothetical protein ABEH47_02700 [Haloferacaceae archaeon]